MIRGRGSRVVVGRSREADIVLSDPNVSRRHAEIEPTPAGVRIRDMDAWRAYQSAVFARTERRVVSYWDCYYRWKYPVFGTYPGSILAEAFRSAASAISSWERRTSGAAAAWCMASRLLSV